jgi:hypothetical protein
VHLVRLSIAALERAGKRISLAALARTSKTVDPEEPDGVSESAILHNEEAYALYRQHAPSPRPRQRGSKVTACVGQHRLVRVRADRDPGHARRRYMRASKPELVERLLAAEEAYADMQTRWLKTADDLLAWIMLVDRLLAGKIVP